MRGQLIVLLIILLAFGLRVIALDDIPPGLTHDEANHGRGAIGILDGALLFYFPLNYGSEPLYDYVVAGAMAALGEGVFALRLVNVLAGTVAVALTYAWTRRRLDRLTAVAAMAFMAVSFWPLATSREALRAGLLPLLMLGTVISFWGLLSRVRDGRSLAGEVGAFALLVALTWHNYLAARVLWLAFPLFWLLQALAGRTDKAARRGWLATVIGLALVAVLVTPMFLYLDANPEAETRLTMLNRPLEQLQTGEWRPLLENGVNALLALVVPGYGDQFLAYNIPGRPTLQVVTAVLFVSGLAICLVGWRRPVNAFLLAWLAAGLLPSLVTGPTANTTRNIGMQPALYIVAANGLIFLLRRLPVTRRGRGALAVLVLGWTAVFAANDYFVNWAQRPDVRAAYRHPYAALGEAWTSFDAEQLEAGQGVVSSPLPGPVHDASVALLTSPSLATESRWIDARHALLFPGGVRGWLLAPSTTPPNLYLSSWLIPLETYPLRPSDLDPTLQLYRVLAPPPTQGEPLALGEALTLLGHSWLANGVNAGDTAALVTWWRVDDPTAVGPRVPPAFTTDVVFFTQVLDGAGGVLAQDDRLDAPSWSWRAGDVVMQMHQLPLPGETAPGQYEAIVGVYDRQSGARLPVDGRAGETAVAVDPLTVLRPE